MLGTIRPLFYILKTFILASALVIFVAVVTLSMYFMLYRIPFSLHLILTYCTYMPFVVPFVMLTMMSVKVVERTNEIVKHDEIVAIVDKCVQQHKDECYEKIGDNHVELDP